MSAAVRWPMILAGWVLLAGGWAARADGRAALCFWLQLAAFALFSTVLIVTVARPRDRAPTKEDLMSDRLCSILYDVLAGDLAAVAPLIDLLMERNDPRAGEVGLRVGELREAFASHVAALASVRFRCPEEEAFRRAEVRSECWRHFADALTRLFHAELHGPADLSFLPQLARELDAPQQAARLAEQRRERQEDPGLPQDGAGYGPNVPPMQGRGRYYP